MPPSLGGEALPLQYSTVPPTATHAGALTSPKTHLTHTDKTAGQEPLATGSRMATHST